MKVVNFSRRDVSNHLQMFGASIEVTMVLCFLFFSVYQAFDSPRVDLVSVEFARVEYDTRMLINQSLEKSCVFSKTCKIDLAIRFLLYIIGPGITKKQNLHL